MVCYFKFFQIVFFLNFNMYCVIFLNRLAVNKINIKLLASIFIHNLLFCMNIFVSLRLKITHQIIFKSPNSIVWKANP